MNEMLSTLMKHFLYVFFCCKFLFDNNTWMDGKYRLCINVLEHWRTYVCLEQYDKCFSNKMKWYDLYSTWLIWSYCFFHFKLHSPKLNQTNENKQIEWLEFYHRLLFVCIIQTTTSVFVIRNKYCKMKTKKNVKRITHKLQRIISQKTWMFKTCK